MSAIGSAAYLRAMRSQKRASFAARTMAAAGARGRSARQPLHRAFAPADEDVLVDIPDVAQAAERHGDVELLADDVERGGDALLAHGAEPVEEGAADEGALGAERDRLQHVLAGADAAIEQYLHAAADLLDDAGQGL